MLPKNKVFIVVKWLVTLTAYGFLIYKLAHIEYWDELKLSFLNIGVRRTLFFVFVVLLMPLNWALETKKWQILTSKSCKLTFLTSLKSVLTGLNTGYITPNRIGEFAGRIVFMPEKDRWTGVLLSAINSLTQNMVMTLLGVAGGAFYFTRHYQDESLSAYFTAIAVGILLCVILYFCLPGIVQKMKVSSRSEKLREVFKSLSSFDARHLSTVLFYSFLRYAVFFLQFLLMLHFFKINITVLQALTAIPTMYLLITFTPSFAASEPAIRSSYAVLVFSVFSQNEIGILLTGILIWLINFVVPMLIGSTMIMKAKPQNTAGALILKIFP